MDFQEAKKLTPGTLLMGSSFMGTIPKVVVARIEVRPRVVEIYDQHGGRHLHKTVDIPSTEALARWYAEDTKRRAEQAQRDQIKRVRDELGLDMINYGSGFHAPPNYKAHIALERAVALCDELAELRARVAGQKNVLAVRDESAWELSMEELRAGRETLSRIAANWASVENFLETMED